MFASEMPPEIPQTDSASAELTTWAFLQDLDFEQEPDVGVFSLPQGSADIQTSSSERLKEKNRKAQKRFRERKKVSRPPSQAERTLLERNHNCALRCMHTRLYVPFITVGTDADYRSAAC